MKTLNNTLNKNRILTITGSKPGVGKSHCVQSIIKALKKDKYPVAYCATTHRASENGKTECSLLKSYIKLPDGKFFYSNSELHEDKQTIIIVDEAMLCSRKYWQDEVNRYPNCLFILVGDIMQFDPVDGFEPLTETSILLDHVYRQNENDFIDFISKLRNGTIDLEYIKNNFVHEKYSDIKYISTCYTKDKEKNLASDVLLKYSENKHDYLYSEDNENWKTLSKNKPCKPDGEDKTAIHSHLMQGLTLTSELGLSVTIDDVFNYTNFYSIMLRYLYVSFTRIKEKRQIVMSEEDYQKLVHIVEQNKNIPIELPKLIGNYMTTDSDFISSLTGDEILSLFETNGFNLEKEANRYYLNKSEINSIIFDRYLNKMKMRVNDKTEMYLPENPLNRNQWLKTPWSNETGCSSHHYYLFEIDYPKDCEMTPEVWSEYIKKNYIDPYKHIFTNVTYSGNNSYHCHLYNHSELNEKEYKALWHKINVEVFDGKCDKSRCCYNACLTRAPFVIRESTGKEQSDYAHAFCAWNFNSEFVASNTNLNFEKAEIESQITFEGVDCSESIIDELTFIENSNWKITDVDGTGRWHILCSIVEYTSNSKYRRLTNSALEQVYWIIGKRMKLSDQRIIAAIKKMNRHYTRIVTEDRFSELRKQKADFNKQNDEFFKLKAETIYQQYGLKTAIESLFLMYDSVHRIPSLKRLFSCLKVASVKDSYKQSLLKNGYNFSFDTNVAEYMNISDKSAFSTVSPKCRSIRRNKNEETKKSCKMYIRKPIYVNFFDTLNNLKNSDIRDILKDSKVLQCTELHNVAVSKAVKIANTKTDRNALLLEDYRNGMKQKDIAEKYGIKKSAVSRLLKRLCA